MNQVFEHLLFMPEMLDERNKWNFVTAMLQPEAALSTAQADIGPIPASTAQIIRGGCHIDAFDVQQLLANRRRVLGDARIEKSLAGSNDFNTWFQSLITSYPWNEIWSRPGLGDKTRQLRVLSTMIVPKNHEEFALYVRAGLDDPPESRLSPEDIKEAIDQAAIYCGVPAVNHAMGVAAGILREKGFLPHQETP